MYAYPEEPRALRPVETLAAATAAAGMALGLLWGVATLFQSRGAPLEELAAAERACASQVYVSDREACMKQWIAENQRTRVAGTGGSQKN
jgi:hypothetical protein